MATARKAEVDPRRLKLASDPYRPAYHYLAPANWLNDPNGTIFWKGRYHVFYQHNPNGAFWGDMHWGHASSEDLVHWTDHPIALAPGPGGADRLHCFSGAAFVSREGKPTFFYHGVPDGICIATSHDDLLLRWEKHPANPVIPNPGPRDKYRINGTGCAWIEGDDYYAITGNSVESPDAAYLFRSRDLAHWEYLHPLYIGGRFTDAGEDCAVPDFFPLGGKHVLLFASHLRGAQCYIGTYANHVFTPERHKRLVGGLFGRTGGMCEGLTLLDGAGRRILFGRISEARYGFVQRASGWSGIFSLPIVMSLTNEGELNLDPVPELESLRDNHRRVADLPLAAGAVVPLEGIRGDRLEIRAEFECGDAEEFGLAVRCSSNGEEQTLVRFTTNPHQLNPDSRQFNRSRWMIPALILDVTRSSVSPDVCNREPHQCQVPLADGEKVELRVFVDRSVVEVFANHRHYLCKRIYPARDDSLGVRVYSLGGTATLRSLDAWDMQAVWPIR